MTDEHETCRSFASLLDYRPGTALLDGRVILVTGAADGIGRAVAGAYASHGARTVLLDWNSAGLDAAYEEFTAADWPEPVLCPADLSGITLTQLREVVQRIGDRFGVLDGLLNNAGWIGALTPFEHYQPNVWAKVMNINMAAPFFLTQWCLPLLRKSVDPAVVFSLHDAARAYWGGYAMAKAGQEALVHILAEEYGPESSQPIRVTGIDPGPVMTPGRRQHYPGEHPDAHPFPEDVVGPYLFAMGPDARGSSGRILRDSSRSP